MTMTSVLGVDLGKNSCSVVGLDSAGTVTLRRRVSREALVALLGKLPACTVAMEACCGAHFVGRAARAHGHEVRLMPPEYVRPYVKAQKNDDRDAEAIAEAATRPTMRFVRLKAEEQLDMQALHRARDRLVAERTALINQLRALLLERGIILAQRRRALLTWLDTPSSPEEPDPLSPRLRLLVADMRAEWAELDRRIGVFDEEFAASARADDASRRVSTIPGIGPVNATALIAAIGDARICPCTRLGGLAWSGAQTGDHGWQAEAARHHQARQPLFAQEPHPRGAGGDAETCRNRHVVGALATSVARSGTQEHRRGRLGQQARPDRLGGAGPW